MVQALSNSAEIEVTPLGNGKKQVRFADTMRMSTYIVAFVVGETPDPAMLIDHVASLLSVHKRPREIRIVDSLPRNAMGKVQKQLLR